MDRVCIADAWTVIEMPTNGYFLAASSPAEGHIIAVGRGGLIVRKTPDAWTLDSGQGTRTSTAGRSTFEDLAEGPDRVSWAGGFEVLLRRVGQDWSVARIDRGWDIVSVAPFQGGVHVALRAPTGVARRSGTLRGDNWHELPAGPNGSSPTVLVSTSTGTLYGAVDERVWRFDEVGGRWTSIIELERLSGGAQSIWLGEAQGSLWIAGTSGVLREYDLQGHLRRRDDIPGENYSHLSGDSSANLYVVSRRGLLHFDGTAWQLVEEVPLTVLGDVVARGSDVMVLGRQGAQRRVVHRRGGTWTVHEVPDAVDLGVLRSGLDEVFLLERDRAGVPTRQRGAIFTMRW